MEVGAAGGGGRRIKLRIFEVASWLWFIITATVAQTQNTTDPAEARVIHDMFRQWGIEESKVANMRWNLSGELCSGAAVDSTPYDSQAYNPGIKCDCSFPNSTCHITRLRVYSLDVEGPIPEGLWTLVYLTNLGIGTNSFNGSLPSELGNLRRLEQLYIDSSGVGGEIPSTFANLQNLVTVWASDNEFTGRIPDFIGNWTQLESLRFEGNSFEGSIPPSFSRLTSLQEL
ncbi:putative non-specific serine/threonine protein kinase [Helianthus annuus]|nr:putative non-specific serine/threonine protein kinase [Helianthus annuus]